MKAYYFYSHNFPEAVEAAHSINAVFMNVSISGWEYAKMVKAVWQIGDPFILIEHDMVVTPSLIAELTNCEEKMCVTHYIYKGYNVYDTGVSKWTPHTIGWPAHKYWIGLTSWMLSNNIYKPHRHETLVKHLGSGHTNAPGPMDMRR